MPYPEDETEEEIKRLEEARRRAGVVGFPNKPVAPPPVAEPSVRFGKPFTAEERAKQSLALTKVLRNRRD